MAKLFVMPAANSKKTDGDMRSSPRGANHPPAAAKEKNHCQKCGKWGASHKFNTRPRITPPRGLQGLNQRQRARLRQCQGGSSRNEGARDWLAAAQLPELKEMAKQMANGN
jgi:hypothetical protein